MKKIISHFAAINMIVVFIISCSQNQLTKPSVSTVDNKIDSILSQMSLKEKVGLMTQINLTVIAKGPNKWGSSFPLEIDHDRAIKALVDYKVGSVLNTINNTAQTPETWYNTNSVIQQYAMDSNRLKIP